MAAEHSPVCQFPYILPSQAQKHVTHNEALAMLDVLVQPSVLDRDLVVPPVSPADGDRYIVAAGGSGAWSGKANKIAFSRDGSWEFLTPVTGWLAWAVDEATLLFWSGSAWAPIATLSPTILQNMTRLGIGTTADAANPFSAKLNKALWTAKTAAEGGDGDLRYTMNKETAADIVSILMQRGFSGRAELGLVGDDNFTIKVSPDGAAWATSLVLDRTTGKASFPAGGVREQLQAARTYYVRIDGSDSNSGLANSSDGAFLTVQKAVDAVASLDLATHQATIQVGAGTFTGAIVLRPYLGLLAPIIVGDETTPANVVISTTSNTCFTADASDAWSVRGFKFQTTTSGDCLVTRNGGIIRFQNVNFGAASCGYHVFAGAGGGGIFANGDYAISGGAQAHCIGTGYVEISQRTITITGTPAFNLAFAFAGRGGLLSVFGNTFSGSATGKRYDTSLNGVIFVAGAGATYLPGNVAGTTAAWNPYQ